MPVVHMCACDAYVHMRVRVMCVMHMRACDADVCVCVCVCDVCVPRGASGSSHSTPVLKAKPCSARASTCHPHGSSLRRSRCSDIHGCRDAVTSMAVVMQSCATPHPPTHTHTLLLCFQKKDKKEQETRSHLLCEDVPGRLQ